jgi:ABC-type multidrug transport system ATPase subunit
MLVELITEIRKLHNLPKIDKTHVFENVDFGYTKNNLIIKGAKFEFSKGISTGIIGSNGTGKTTLFKIFSNYVETHGINSNYKNLKIGYSSSNGNDVNPFMSCKKVLQLCLNSHSMQYFDKVIASLELNKVANNLTNRLSSGQRKKISIFRAFALGRDLILLDEPSAFLDIDSIEMIEKLIYEVKKEIPIVFTTHSKGFLDACADNVYKIETLKNTNSTNINKIQ